MMNLGSGEEGEKKRMRERGTHPGQEARQLLANQTQEAVKVKYTEGKKK